MNNVEWTSRIAFAMVFVFLLSFPTIVSAQDTITKDLWDKADIFAKIVLGLAGLAVPIIIHIGIKSYDRRQDKAENARQKNELALHRIETVHGFLPQLISEDKRISWASLSLIRTLGDEELVQKISDWYINQYLEIEDRQTVHNLMKDSDPVIADLATQAYKRYYSLRETQPLATHLIKYDPCKTTNIISCKEPMSYNDDTSEKYGPFVVTRGHHKLRLPAEFRMGIYLVTNEFFLEFVRANGYAEESFWVDIPRQKRDKFVCQDGCTYGPSTWPSENECLPGRERHPVAGISYYEAQAFCRWLDKKSSKEQSGWHWRLPMEDMWEFTARTKDQRSYPWGSAFVKGRCNSSESSIGTTTDVSAFPKGRSKEGCYDMAGNVWEYVDDPDAENWSCVLRGGSFRNNQSEVRSYLRLYRVPRDHRPPDFGFRCVHVHEGT